MRSELEFHPTSEGQRDGSDGKSRLFARTGRGPTDSLQVQPATHRDRRRRKLQENPPRDGLLDCARLSYEKSQPARLSGGSHHMIDRNVPHIEYSIARCRLVLSLVAVVAVFIDPTEPLLSRWIPLTSGHFAIDPYVLLLLGAHLTYSLTVYAGMTQRWFAAAPIGARTLWIDVAFGAAIAFVTEGVTSPFYPFFAFAVIERGPALGVSPSDAGHRRERGALSRPDRRVGVRERQCVHHAPRVSRDHRLSGRLSRAGTARTARRATPNGSRRATPPHRP